MSGKRRKLEARRLTDKVQVRGYKLLVQRVEQGFLSWDVRGFRSPFVRHTTAIGLGLGMLTLVLVAGIVVGWLSPAGKVGDAKILATKNGSRYVVVDGRVHPVTNLTSARLISGSADRVKTVGESDLGKYPRGQLMGIPSAPDEMIQRRDDSSEWAVCSQYDTAGDLELTKSDALSTVVIAGADAITPGARTVTADQAVLVRSSPAASASSASMQNWLLYHGYRMELGADDFALLAALDLNQSDLDEATVVSRALIDAIPERATPEEPRLYRAGDVSGALPEYAVGDVLAVDSAKEQQFWLVLDDGVQRLSEFAATLMTGQGAALEQASPSAVASVSHREEVDISAWPSRKPQIRSGGDTVCIDWSRKGANPASTTFIAGEGMPMSAESRNKASWLLPARSASTTQSDAFYSAPGKGWLVVASGSSRDSHVAGQLWWISDNGVRYPIEGDSSTKIDKVVESLGIGGEPHRIPWSVLSLLPEGNTISASAAKVIHASIPPDMAQAPQPEAKDLN